MYLDIMKDNIYDKEIYVIMYSIFLEKMKRRVVIIIMFLIVYFNLWSINVK